MQRLPDLISGAEDIVSDYCQQTNSSSLKQTFFVMDIHDPNTRSLALSLLFLCCVVSGATAMVVVQPADVVKTELKLKQF